MAKMVKTVKTVKEVKAVRRVGNLVDGVELALAGLADSAKLELQGTLPYQWGVPPTFLWKAL